MRRSASPRVVLANTSARPGAERMEARRRMVLAGGMAAVAEPVLARFFSPRMLAAESSRCRDGATDAPRDRSGRLRGLLRGDSRFRCHGRALRPSTCPRSSSAARPTNHCRGPATAMCWRHGIAGARALTLPTAHLSNLERPRSFTAAVLAFLLPPAEDVHADGLSRCAARCSAMSTSIARWRRARARIFRT